MRRALPGLLAGMAVGAALWLADLSGAGALSFAGVTDAAARREILRVTSGSLIAFEARLLSLHLILGGGLGLLWAGASSALRRSGGPGRLRLALESAAFAAAVAFCAVDAFVARYPQLVADRWWLAGGPAARWQRFVTHGVGPLPFELVGTLLVAAAALLAVARPAAQAFASPRARARAGAFAGLAALAWVMPAPAPGGRGDRTDVLILAIDSLRGDRLQNPEVMPFVASLAAQGALFPWAVTPIARTYPSWVSTLTGLEPRAHQIRHMFPTRAARREMPATLFTALRDRGYATFAVSDFAGDVFAGFEAGFETLDVPRTTVDTLALSTALAAHTTTAPLLRFRLGRRLLPVWRNIPALADPAWVADAALEQVESADRPFAGLVFFSTAHFPYAAPYPYYREGSGDYEGPYLYHVPPVPPQAEPGAADVEQIRHRYDAALTAIDAAIERIFRSLRAGGRLERTIVVVTGDHGEDLYEEGAGHGDTADSLRSQSVPILVLGPGVRPLRSASQVRLYDLPATILDLVTPDAPRPVRFGHGLSLLDTAEPRPICVETGLWFWPTRPPQLRGRRLEYPGVAELLEVDEGSRELQLRPEMETIVETAKERGIVLGSRAWLERMTPSGIEKRLVSFPEIADGREPADLPALFEQRCVEGDPRLRRVLGGVVFEAGSGEAGP